MRARDLSTWGTSAAAVSEWLGERGGSITREALASYGAQLRAPVRVGYRDREVLTNPPPSAGGTLLAYALALLDQRPGPPALEQVASGDGSCPGRAYTGVRGGSRRGGLPGNAFSPGAWVPPPTSQCWTESGRACSVTCTNGEGSGVVVPGTGIHVNNIMGEQDLNPLGFHRHPAGRRMPSMMAPSVVTRAGEVELVLGSAGSNRIRSALLQTIVGVVDHGLGAPEAVSAPRVHFEEGVVYAEPGIDVRALERGDRRGGRLPRAQPVLRRRPGRPAPRRGAAGRGRSPPRWGGGVGVRGAWAAAHGRGTSARGAREGRVGRGSPGDGGWPWRSLSRRCWRAAGSSIELPDLFVVQRTVARQGRG